MMQISIILYWAPLLEVLLCIDRERCLKVEGHTMASAEYDPL